MISLRLRKYSRCSRCSRCRIPLQWYAHNEMFCACANGIYSTSISWLTNKRNPHAFSLCCCDCLSRWRRRTYTLSNIGELKSNQQKEIHTKLKHRHQCQNRNEIMENFHVVGCWCCCYCSKKTTTRIHIHMLTLTDAGRISVSWIFSHFFRISRACTVHTNFFPLARCQ